MRYIDLNKIELPEGWLDKANSLTQQLTQADSAESRETIMTKHQIWRELFVPLHDLSSGKCWYSESKDAMSDRDIDHFRPKGKATNIDKIPRGDEDGYWWLCYDYENYRFSSQYSNELRKDKFNADKATGGKGNYFPLFEYSTVAKTKARCKDEEIMLLDPCDEDDPYLLTFDSKGKAIPNSAAILNENDKRRVLISIKLYHLDHTPLEELREQTWDFCQRMIDEIRSISSSVEGLSISDINRVKFLKSEIRQVMNKNKALSAVAIACCEENGLSILAERR